MADPGRTRDRRLQLALGTYAVLVFAVLWVGFALGLIAGGQAFADAWAWLNGLEPVARIAAWVLFLPIAVGLWAWNAGLSGAGLRRRPRRPRRVDAGRRREPGPRRQATLSGSCAADEARGAA